MADNATHSIAGGLIAVLVYKITGIGFLFKLLFCLALSMISHIVLDLLPHGHNKNLKIEVLASLTITLVLVVYFMFGDLSLLVLAVVSFFGANIFDVIGEIAKLYPANRISRRLIILNKHLHWFELNTNFMKNYNVRHKDWVDSYENLNSIIWKHSWYNWLATFVLILFLIYSI